MLRYLVCALLISGAVVASAQPEEDAAHRGDRLRTERLNRAAGTVVSERNRGNAAAQARYRAQRADYERRMEDWRRRVAACRQGDYSACDER